MKHILIFLIAVALVASCGERERVDPGIPLDLAISRKAAIQNLSYDLFFNIPESRKDSIPASITIHFDWTEHPQHLQLDYLPPKETIHRVVVNGEEIDIRYRNEHILIEPEALKPKGNTVFVEFTAGEAALNRNDDYLYTLFVPSRASTCFPLFDQPDLKATFNLELLIPPGWKAMSNGSMTDVVEENGKNRMKFAATKPTSAYQFAFTAGKFFSATDPVSGMTMFYRETDTAKVSRNVAKIFELHRTSLTWLTEYTGIPYPYDKFDFALMPAFQFGGMEHPGNIYYRESSLFLEPSASINEELRRASLIAHETAHMWFGNLVTMKWFNDVWLKEVFANFMAAKIVSPSFPTINHNLRFLMSHYPAAYEIDRSQGAHPIQQQLDNLRNAGSVYGAIIYQKAPITMRNLEAWVGAENFQKGLRDYLTKYAYSNATWDDLITRLMQYTREDLAVWDRAWIKTAGMPEIAITEAADGKAFVTIANDPASQVVWPQTVDYQVQTTRANSIRRITFRKSSSGLLSRRVEPGMKFLPNYRGMGYGYFKADTEFLTAELDKQEDVEIRAGIWMTLWETFLREQTPAVPFLWQLHKAVVAEKDPLLLEYLVDKLDKVYWQFLSDEGRQQVAASIEAPLLDRLILEQDVSSKRTLYNAYRSLALTNEGTATLRKMWADELTLGLELSERDHLQLAYALALRQADGFEEILQKQLNRISNPDRKAEARFVQQALSANEAARDAFFEKLKERENRVREPWVLEAVRYLHHPLRSQSSVRYLPASLNLLVEIQRTGDIFFPKGWLDATLGQYRSKEAADAVREYLARTGNLRQDLRNKLLQSADMLFRAEQRALETAYVSSQ